MAATAVVLDLDGTVWNSRPWYAETIARLSGVSALRVEQDLQVGISVVQAAKDRGVSRTRLIGAAEKDGGAIELYERVIPTLDQLRVRGTPICIVTNLPGWLVQPLLQSTGVGEHITAIATPGAGKPAKPSPLGIWRVLSQIELEANPKIWFVGDEATDAEAAKAASVRFAWASFGYGANEPHGTDKVLMHFGEALDL